MDTQIAVQTKPDVLAVIVPRDADKHTRSRLGQFARWMYDQRLPWHKPDLAAYRDAMLADGKAPSTVSAHLSTVRARYGALIRDDGRRDELYTLAGDRLAKLGQDDDPANRAAFVSEILARLENATDPAASPVKVKVRQDTPDSEHLRLTSEQASALMSAPGLHTLKGLRDTAVIALMLCTGIREAELCALDVGDLRQRLGGELALHVRQGKGCKERLIPYGALDWVLVVVDAWLAAAGITDGAVFRGLYKGGERLRPGRLSVRGVQTIMSSYPITIDGELVKTRPHDCRRTYAARLYDAGVDIVAIQQNLGHADIKTTLGYIGDLDAQRRRAPAIYTFHLNGLLQQREMDL
jgi:site-specific recombinase XerD